MNWILTAIILILFGLLWKMKKKEKRLLLRLRDMLEQASRGSYEETDYDESLLSSIEAKMVHFLNSSVLSKKKISKERDRIKALISDISHQTKTPLANIVLYSQLLSEQKLSGEAAVAVRALESQSEKLQFLIDALVKMSRLENGIIALQPEKNSVRQLILETLEEVRQKAENKGVSIDFFMEKDQLALFDRKWTIEALYNIVDNGVKYTPEGGQVALRVKVFNLFCCIEVEDTGAGIEEGEQSQIFKRFYRGMAGKDTEGVGVGLYLAREILSAEGGYIKVMSEPGRGSVFGVYLLTSEN